MKHFKTVKIKIVPSLLCACAFALSVSFAHAAATDNQVSENGLAAYWNFNEATGTIAHDASGNGNTGTLVNSPVWVKGVIGSALQFNGSNSYVSTGYTIPAQSSATSLTWSAWVKLTSNSGVMVIMGFRNGATWMKLTPNAFEYSAGGIISYTIPTNQWVQVTIVKNGTSFTYYANNVIVGTATNSSSVVAHTFYMGEDPGFTADGDVSGDIDEVHVWNRALSATEVANLYKQGTDFIDYSGGSLNNGSTLTSGLAAYWTFDGKNINWATGIMNDVSGNGHNGTLMSMSSTTSPTEGKTGQALTFNGSSSYVNVSSVPSVSNPLTVSVWVYPTSLSQSSFGSGVGGTIIDENEGGGTAGWVVGIKSTGQVWFWPSGGNDKLSSSSIPLGKWSHVAATYDGTNLRIYINGVLDSTQAMSAPQGSATFFKIGAKSWITGYWSGKLDDVRVYSRALSASEIAQMYVLGGGELNAPSSVLQDGSTLGSGLIGYWTFDNKNMTWKSSTVGTSTDISGNGYNGTLVSMNLSTSPVEGKLGQALSFNGTSQYVNVSSITGTPNYSISFWEKTTSTAVGGIFQWNGGGTTFCKINQQAVGEVNCSPANSSGSSATTASNTYNNGKWHNIVFVANSNATQSIYADGVLAGTATQASSTPNSSLTIGDTSAAFFTGSLDDFRIYNRALSASEAASLYNLGK